MIDFDKLARDVFNEVFEIIKTWAQELPTSITSSLPHAESKLAISVCAIRNGRRKMEDKHVLLPHLAQLYPSLQVTQARNATLLCPPVYVSENHTLAAKFVL